jgi:hypothetical protein
MSDVDGRQQFVTFRGAGSVLGEFGALNGGRRSATVLALTPLRVRVYADDQVVPLGGEPGACRGGVGGVGDGTDVVGEQPRRRGGALGGRVLAPAALGREGAQEVVKPEAAGAAGIVDEVGLGERPTPGPPGAGAGRSARSPPRASSSAAAPGHSGGTRAGRRRRRGRRSSRSTRGRLGRPRRARRAHRRPRAARPAPRHPGRAPGPAARRRSAAPAATPRTRRPAARLPHRRAGPP